LPNVKTALICKKKVSITDPFKKPGSVNGGGSFHLSLRDGKLSDDDVARLLAVFETSGLTNNLSSHVACTTNIFL
jgi:hypothetical protein